MSTPNTGATIRCTRCKTRFTPATATVPAKAAKSGNGPVCASCVGQRVLFPKPRRRRPRPGATSGVVFIGGGR
jgi:DNA-directed RNA polymerase subunit RPC12/RpoP